MQGADLKDAIVWQTIAPNESALQYAELDRLRLEELDSEMENLLGFVIKFFHGDVRKRVAERLAPLYPTAKNKDWKATEDHKFWEQMKRRASPEATKIAAFLAALACRDSKDGYVIKGISRRARGNSSPPPYGVSLAKALLQDSCQGIEALDDDARWMLRNLARHVNPR